MVCHSFLSTLAARCDARPHDANVYPAPELTTEARVPPLPQP
ncbi:hypothetical protein DDI_0490 [Dickeya dianthicola RNS04.9]|nr:hypothetical protein DDI_0490 [Dickeya dianthicola RNS04.9]